ncbi:MAG: SUMF1/EgtB/PvdO family nonheme iron enzyme [Albidovulum sp.]|nr:SUMF1/EgtB/PvdO family nonheme iron enzyme [Albidovulum sp.]
MIRSGRVLFDHPSLGAVGHAAGYMPRIVAFSHEDKAAKGLRSLQDDQGGHGPTIRFGAVEIVAKNRAVLLRAPRGGGKTVFVQELEACLKGESSGDPVFNLGRLNRSVCRNDDGLFLRERWSAPLPTVISVDLSDDGQAGFRFRRGRDQTAVMAILDGLDHLAADRAGRLLEQAMTWLRCNPDSRLLVTGETETIAGFELPPDLAKHDLMPVPGMECRALCERLGFKEPERNVARWPGPFALWAVSGIDAPPWEQVRSLVGTNKAQRLAENAARQVGGDAERTSFFASNHVALDRVLAQRWLRDVLAARHLATEPIDQVVSRISDRTDRWIGSMTLFALDLPAGSERAAALVRGLMTEKPDPRMLLLASRLVQTGEPDSEIVRMALAAGIERGGFPVEFRRMLGQALALLGDPRELDKLVGVPAGTFRIGGGAHPNSRPEHVCSVEDYRIGAYPVTNSAYQEFATAAGRPWRSADAARREFANAPAVDLTWHDAMGYCAWLTSEWRAVGRIGAHEIVRLPTEPEWEVAARGPRGWHYPWGAEWAAGHANGEEAGLNEVCSVGLFPEGVSPFGCMDMAGQVWEWTTTLWGEDMGTPSFAYPYRNDGREDLDAGPSVRRVLRGGCFSSNRMKANGIYRGSLEPAGFWRGNGFRIVVANKGTKPGSLENSFRPM